MLLWVMWGMGMTNDLTFQMRFFMECHQQNFGILCAINAFADQTLVRFLCWLWVGYVLSSWVILKNGWVDDAVMSDVGDGNDEWPHFSKDVFYGMPAAKLRHSMWRWWRSTQPKSEWSKGRLRRAIHVRRVHTALIGWFCRRRFYINLEAKLIGQIDIPWYFTDLFFLKFFPLTFIFI